jgi:hypothetical protein
MKSYIFPSLFLLLLSCGQAEPKKTQSDTTQTAENPKPSRAFIELSPKELNALKVSLEPGVEICDCYKTTSKDYASVWAAACNAKNGLTDVGVWAIGKNSGFYSVTSYTTLISDWGLKSDITLTDDGFQEVVDYVKTKPGC